MREHEGSKVPDQPWTVPTAVAVLTTPAHALSTEEVAGRLGSDRVRGLTPSEAERRLEEQGPNELAQAPPVPAWKKLLEQFKQAVILVLIGAALVSGAIGEWADAVAIIAIVILNGVVGFLQEEKAERALAALEKMAVPKARVVRGGELLSLPAQALVPGDRVLIEAGDRVPADARLLEAFALTTQEAALTGESVPVGKDAGAVLPLAAPLGDRTNMVHMGTIVAAGKGTAVVTATGMATELGHVAGLLARHEPEPTPLQVRLTQLGRTLLFVCLGAAGLIFLLLLLRGGSLVAGFLIAVSLAVAAVPEGLPAVVTIGLALGLQRMARRNALIRKLPSVETLGAVTVIASDKTGTLTKNEMTVRELVTPDGAYHLTGAGYAPNGDLVAAAAPGQPLAEIPVDAARALRIGLRCNGAKVVPTGADADSWTVIGDPTEGALVVAARKARLAEEPRPVVFEIPFDSDRKAMSVVVREPEGPVMYTKGALESVLLRSTTEVRNGAPIPLTEARKEAVRAEEKALAARALRVLALAYRESPEPTEGGYAESGLCFAGLVGMIDPPRDEARDAIARARRAGIRPIMITGDHPVTAMAIARELGIAGPNDRVVTGQELAALGDDQLAAQVESIAVYARVTAEHKMRIVRAWKARGQLIGMTGDGVNDAPALRAADIGMAMGKTGTEVAKEASAMVIADDNFASIVAAVEEGRAIYDNIQKVVQYLLSCNAGEILFMLFAALIGWPAPLMPIQLLWINLVTDGLPALGLAMEPAERDLMERPPRPAREPVLTWRRGLRLLLVGSLVAGVTAVAFWAVYKGHAANLPRARTTAFCVLSFSQLSLALVSRSGSRPLWRLGLGSNLYLLAAVAISALLQLSVVMLPFARPVFQTARHLAWEWPLLVVLAAAPAVALEIGKSIHAALARRDHQAASQRPPDRPVDLSPVEAGIR